MDAHGVPVQPETIEKARKSDAVLLGAVGDPKYDDPKAKVRPEQGLLSIRKGLGLFANLRPVKLFDQLVEASPVRSEVVRGNRHAVRPGADRRALLRQAERDPADPRTGPWRWTPWPTRRARSSG